MKVFFDTNVYVAEALLGKGAQRLVEATRRARWRVFTSQHVLDETAEVLREDLHFSRKLANLMQRRIIRRSILVEGQTRARVPGDPKDSPILQAALICGADYLVSNDRHLLALNPFESLRIVSMAAYLRILHDHGLLK